MTRKDYILIADAIRETLADIARDSGNEDLSDRGRAVLAGERIGAHTIAMRLGDRLRQGNPRFEMRRFIEACGMEF